MSDTIRLKQVVAEDFCNYKLPSMFLITCFCDWKCCTEGNFDTSVCQNFSLKDYPIKEYSFILLYKFYMSNPITKAIIVGGLEPLLQSEELYNLISFFREKGCNDKFIIYTGYTEEEVTSDARYSKLLTLSNITFKFGRFKLNDESRFDDVLGIELASQNQYGKEYNTLA